MSYSHVILASLFALSLLSAKPLPTKVEQIMQQTKYQHANWGILVKDATTQEVLYEKNSNQLFLPGSTTKIFSAAALVHAYGDDYRFKTPVYATGPIKKGVLQGNLILVGQGDLTFGGRQEIGSDTIAFTKMDHIYANALPEVFLTPQDPLGALNALAKEIKEKGVSKIEGDVLIDDRLFESIQLRGMMESPVMINENLIDIVLRPTTPGKPADVTWRPHVTGYTITNACQTVAKGGTLDIDIDSQDGGRIIRISGTLPQDQKEVIRTFSIQDPHLFAKYAFIQALQRQGIVVDAKGEAKLPPKSAYASMQQIALWTSPPLSEYVKLILKVSHNVGANLVPLLLAAKSGGATFDEGMREFGKFTTQEVGVSSDSFVFIDGAGGDENRLTPEAEVKLLEYVRNWPKEQFQKYYNGLPILGVDGSIEDFGKGSPAAGKVYAKTGTGISFNIATSQFFLTTQALSGYIEGKNGHLLEFMVAVNNGNMPKIEDIFAIFDDECQMTIEFYNASGSAPKN